MPNYTIADVKEIASYEQPHLLHLVVFDDDWNDRDPEPLRPYSYTNAEEALAAYESNRAAVALYQNGVMTAYKGWDVMQYRLVVSKGEESVFGEWRTEGFSRTLIQLTEEVLYNNGLTLTVDLRNTWEPENE